MRYSIALFARVAPWLTLACASDPSDDRGTTSDAQPVGPTEDTDSEGPGPTTDTPPSDTPTDSDTGVRRETGLPATGDTADTRPPSDTAVEGPWLRTVLVDGSVVDFLGEESFVTSSGTMSFLTWDDDNLYIAVQHPNVATGPGADNWIVATIGNGTGGSLVGVAVEAQMPALPFEATHALMIKADGSYSSLIDLVANTQTPNWLGTAGSALAHSDVEQVLELSVPFANLGISSTFAIHVNMVDEIGPETTYAAIPASSFADGFDPDYSAYYEFDLLGSTPPNSYAELP